jgi:hypothetical protein
MHTEGMVSGQCLSYSGNDSGTDNGSKRHERLNTGEEKNEYMGRTCTIKGEHLPVPHGVLLGWIVAARKDTGRRCSHNRPLTTSLAERSFS